MDMEKSYTETFALRTGMCDMAGRWKPAAILEAMQETATTHCNRLGLSRPVTDGLGIVWVLSRSRVALRRGRWRARPSGRRSCRLTPILT